MKKTLLLIGCAVFLFGCNSITNLDNDPKFKPFLGKVLKTKKDLVVMDFRDKKTLALHIPGTQGVPELKDVPQALPYQYFDHVTHGIFPAGGTFQIVHVENVKSVEFSINDFYAVILSEGKFKGQKLDVTMLTDQTIPQKTSFNAKFIEEINP